jgi:cysteine synthase
MGFQTYIRQRIWEFPAGNSPVRLLSRRLRQLFGFPASVRVAYKDETYNPTGSSKARAAKSMLLAAEREKRLRPTTELVEASSGNTATALARLAAWCGLRSILFVPESTSSAKIELILTPGGASVVHCLGSSEDARRSAEAFVQSQRGRRDLLYLDQYNNVANKMAHVRTTGPEIQQQTKGRVTHIFAGIGTGATASGLAEFFCDTDVEVIGVQPAAPRHLLHGLKYLPGVPEDLQPANAQLEKLAGCLFVHDKEARQAVEQLSRSGLRFGPSSGAVLAAAARWAGARGDKPAFIVLIFPDSLDLYLEEYPQLPPSVETSLGHLALKA